jgi:hypothetical protein
MGRDARGEPNHGRSRFLSIGFCRRMLHLRLMTTARLRFPPLEIFAQRLTQTPLSLILIGISAGRSVPATGILLVCHDRCDTLPQHWRATTAALPLSLSSLPP